MAAAAPGFTPEPVSRGALPPIVTIKVSLVGGSSVDKPGLAIRFVEGPGESLKDTGKGILDASFMTCTVQLGSVLATFGIWDTPGQERYHNIAAMTSSRSDAAIVVYSVEDMSSFNRAKQLVVDIQQRAKSNIVIALVGNVIVDPLGDGVVEPDEALSYAEDNGLLFATVSSVTGENVDSLFRALGQEVLRKKQLDLPSMNRVKLPVSEVNVLKNNIRRLNVSHNELKELPEGIGTLINLTHLFASYNRLSILPPTMKHLKKLQVLDLRHNELNRLDIGELKHLEKLYLEGNPLPLQVIRRLMEQMNSRSHKLFIDITDLVPLEILAQGGDAKLLYEQALREGSVNVYRGRILFIGQDRAGKTSLKKSLLGLPFDPKEQSTEGIEVDPSKFEIEVDRVKSWCATRERMGTPGLSEFSKEISRMLAEMRYHSIVGEGKEDSRTKLEEETPRKESRQESKIKVQAQSEIIPYMKQFAKGEDSQNKTKMPSQTWNMEAQDQFGSADTRNNPDLMIDATSAVDDVTKHATQWLKYLFREGLDAESVDKQKESKVTLDLWDFAGQHLYYASHPVFLSSRAIYILVHNLSKPLDALAQPCVRQGTHNIVLENPNNETNLENLLSWLVTIHSIKPTGKEMQKDLPYLRPPVFIVGTHADKPFEDTETVTSKIQQGIAGKEYEKHVIRPFFNVDNTQNSNSVLLKIKNLFVRKSQGDDSDADGIHALQTRIMEVLRQEPYMGEKTPVRWFNFEKVIEAMVAKKVFYTSVERLQTYAKEVCLIDDEDQFNTMLNFYHNLGLVVKHRSTVILKAQWLIDLFKQLITIPHFDKVDPMQSKYWQELERSGVLSIKLVDHVFSSFIHQGLIKEDILDMMERFGLIAKFSPTPTDVKYFVPAQLKSSPEDLLRLEPSLTDPCSLYLHFVDGFVPHGLFSQLVSRFTSWCSKTGCTQPPNLYLNGARFVIGRQVIHDLILICRRRFIKISLKCRTQDEAVSTSQSAEVAITVRLFVDDTLNDLSQELPHLRGLQYELCVACPYCLQGDQQCANHNQTSCSHENCLHLLEIKQGEPLICMKGFCDKVLTVSGLEKWFSWKTSQDMSPSIITGTSQVYPESCGRTLKVTLLASEWSSSMGGLSTINRHLAILLAKHAQVNVTLLVPQFSCGEEERRAAASHNIAIREAESRPGFSDPLDWLSFPPRDIATDILLGHGAKLGKQAQVIRESHCCKWVQVVHTAPEELGMHKEYPKAISKGEEKNRAEVDLCKLADAVVAVGPKLTEAYSSYLRSCEKHQNIIQLTPGTFSEFSDVKQAQIESDKFKVLTFGRGDPEDFSLKGYDIVAKAIAELKDSSYRLIFVGAPEGKQEEVAENLLQSGIAKDQLFVRRFVKSKERLKELFCEVDLCIMPSRTEGFGLTALEALSAGLPILVSGNSGFGDALRVLPLGKPFVVESSDPEEWANAITAVRLKDRTDRLEEIQRLRTCYEENYNWEKQCDTLVQKMWSMVYG